MKADEIIRERIRRMLASGDLLCEEPEETWAGNGDGQRCAACAEPIPPTEIEYEVSVPGGRVFRLHRRCHRLWMEECAPTSEAPEPA